MTDPNQEAIPLALKRVRQAQDRLRLVLEPANPELLRAELRDLLEVDRLLDETHAIVRSMQKAAPGAQDLT